MIDFFRELIEGFSCSRRAGRLGKARMERFLTSILLSYGALEAVLQSQFHGLPNLGSRHVTI
jgi:hypothetical protein